MSSFLVDEDMPRSTAPALRAAGHTASDVRDIGLRGSTDGEIFAHAQATGSVRVTGDMGFANLLRYPLGTHAGLIVMRVPNSLPTQRVNQILLAALVDLVNQDLRGCLIIVEPARARIRRPSPPAR